MHTILVPLDGSELAQQVLPYARTLAALFSAPLRLIQVVSREHQEHFLVQSPALLWGASDPRLRTMDLEKHAFQVLHARAENYLNTIAGPLRQEGFDVETDVHFGVPAVCITETAAHRAVKMIAMVTHGYSGLQRWTLGSVTDKVVQTTTTPVFIVRAQAQILPAEPQPIKRILVPLDGSDFSKQALPIAIELATQSQASIHLVHALLPDDEYPAFVRVSLSESLFQQSMDAKHRWASQQLSVAAAEIQHNNISVSSQISLGHPAETIIAAASQQQSDVIVMATHGYGGLRRWVLGSVADKVLHATTPPLLLVHVTEN